MKRLWRIWTAFGVCLAIGLVGMGWLTLRAMDLDRAEAAARREAEEARYRTALQERIAKALWRMDWTLAPLIAEEATRPSFLYRPVLAAPAAKKAEGLSSGMTSPLLTQPPRWVILNFEVSATQEWTSPQAPGVADEPVAVAAGVSPQVIAENREKLRSLRSDVSFDRLLSLLPDMLLPSDAQPQPGMQTPRWNAPGDYAVLGEYGQQQSGQDDPQVASESQPVPRAQRPPAADDYTESPRAPFQAAGTPHQRGNRSYDQTVEQQEWQRRNVGMQNVARSQRAQLLSSNSILLPDAPPEREGVSRPVWIGSKLILARRVVGTGDMRIQGCWLDWPAIKQRLQADVADLFPDIELLPVTVDQNAAAGRLLATLPVRLVVPDSAADALPAVAVSSPAGLSAMRVSLLIAWCCLLLASLAAAIMLRSVLALSERRAAFVSAVTHELRSPLTTFRLYAEMLAEGMIRDDSQRDQYLATLRQEADRLSHLVENVLQYARLERCRQPRPRVALDLKTLLRQTTDRLPDRARQAGMELHEMLDPQDADVMVLTDPAAVEQILFNLVDNSCKYAQRAADRRIHLQWSVGQGAVRVRVTDHGPGIAAAQARNLFRPFRKSDQEAAQSAPGIGLGLALCRRLARDIGGRLRFEPVSGPGAAFVLELPLAK